MNDALTYLSILSDFDLGVFPAIFNADGGREIGPERKDKTVFFIVSPNNFHVRRIVVPNITLFENDSMKNWLLEAYETY